MSCWEVCDVEAVKVGFMVMVKWCVGIGVTPGRHAGDGVLAVMM